MPTPAPSRKDRRGISHPRKRASAPNAMVIATMWGWLHGTITRGEYDRVHAEHCPCCIEADRRRKHRRCA